MSRFLRIMAKMLMWTLIIALLGAAMFVFQLYLMPDDSNVTGRFTLGVTKLMRGVNGRYVVRLSESSLNVPSETAIEGTFDGSYETGFQITSAKSQSVATDGSSMPVSQSMYLDVVSDTLYVQEQGVWFSYENGITAVDPDWWRGQLEGVSFQYEGWSTSLNGAKSLVLEHVYSGDAATDLLKHLHFSFDGEVDLEHSDLNVIIYVDPIMGRPNQVSLQAASTGYPIVITKADGSLSTVTSFTIDFVVDGYDGLSSVEIPTEVSDAVREPMRDTMALVAPVQPMVQVISDFDGDIVSGDWSIKFGPNPVFDKVSASGMSRLDVSSSQILLGQPTLAIYFARGLDTYSAAKDDADTTLRFYNNCDGLSEIFVTPAILQTYVSGHVAYLYSQQYTDLDNGFVRQDYCAYIELSDVDYVCVVLSSMVDPGVNTVLTEDYMLSILKDIEISDRVGDTA